MSFEQSIENIRAYRLCKGLQGQGRAMTYLNLPFMGTQIHIQVSVSISLANKVMAEKD